MSRPVAALLVAAMLGCGRSPAAPTAVDPGRTFPSGDIRIGYTLDLPPGPGPFPALVLGHGSGRSTREEARPIASRLQGAGFAVLRYDKRGVGASGGVYEGVGVANSTRVLGDLANDMAAGVAFLRTDPRIDARRIGLIGVSQAGWIMPLAASRSPDVAFMVLVVGPTVSVGTEIHYSGLADGTTTPLDEVYAQMPAFTGPHGYDPAPTLATLSTPGLWLLGETDRSVPTRMSVDVLQGLRDGGRPYRWIVYPQAGHNLGASVDYMSDALAFLEPFRH